MACVSVSKVVTIREGGQRRQVEQVAAEEQDPAPCEPQATPGPSSSLTTEHRALQPKSPLREVSDPLTGS